MIHERDIQSALDKMLQNIALRIIKKNKLCQCLRFSVAFPFNNYTKHEQTHLNEYYYTVP